MTEAATTVSPLQLVIGEEPLLIERAVKAAIDSVHQAEPAADVTRVPAAELTASWLTELVSPSLFSESRVVVLESAHDASQEAAGAISTYAANPVSGVVLVVVHSGGGRSNAGKSVPNTLRKAGAAVADCAKITKPAEREAFVRDEVRQAGGRIDSAAVSALVESVGSDLRELSSAASQLVADSGGTINERAVRQYHTGRADVTGFAVAEKVMAGEHAAALISLRWALHIGVAQVLIADALADAVRTVARVAAAGRANPNTMASQLGMPPWKVRKAQGQARGWTREGLTIALRLVAALNADVKGASADADYALERAVRDLVALRAQ